MEQWFIVEKDTNKVIEGSNQNTLEDCIFWYIEPEICEADTHNYLQDLWFKISKRDNVIAKSFNLIE